VPEPQILFGLAQFVAFFGGGFYFVGRMTKTQETLGEIAKDHEHRIRVIERDSVYIPIENTDIGR
jgi:hypothetical protein